MTLEEAMAKILELQETNKTLNKTIETNKTEYETKLTEHETKITKLEEGNEKLRDTNMDLFLKVNSQYEGNKTEEPTEEPTEKEISFKDVLDKL